VRPPGHASETPYCIASALGYIVTEPPIKATEAWRATAPTVNIATIRRGTYM